MVSWKIALVVIVIAILVVAIGMWFGYQYVSEQEDITPVGWRQPANTGDLYGYQLIVSCKYCLSSYLFKKGDKL